MWNVFEIGFLLPAGTQNAAHSISYWSRPTAYNNQLPLFLWRWNDVIQNCPTRNFRLKSPLHKLLLLQPLWILRTQLSLRPHTLSSSHSAPLRSLPVERRRHQCFQRLTSSAVSQWCSTSSRKSSRDFSPVQRWSSFLSASCSRVGMNTLRAKCVSSACQSAEWTPERWIYCCYRWSHVSLCEHVHIKGAGLLRMTNHRHGQFDWQQSLIFHNEDQTAL